MRRNQCSRPEPWTKHWTIWTIWTICRKRFFHVLPYTILHLYVKTLQTGNWEQRTYQCDRFIRGGDEHEIKVRPSHCFLVPSFEHELVWVSCKQISEPVLSFSDSSIIHSLWERPVGQKAALVSVGVSRGTRWCPQLLCIFSAVYSALTLRSRIVTP